MTLSPEIFTRKDKLKNSWYAGIFLVSLSTLFLEFTLVRILSVSLWYHFAFMIISIAMLGIGVSGIVLSISRKLRETPAGKLLSYLSLAYGISIILSFLLFNQVPFEPFSLLSDSMQFIYLPLYYILITMPFFFSGLIISLLLTRFKSEVARLYFFDLIGAGLACIAFCIFIPLVGGNGAVFIIAAIGFLASMIFSFSDNKRVFALSSLLLVISFTFLINKDERFPINVTKNKLYHQFIKNRPEQKVLTEWNTFSKVDVMINDEPAQDQYETYIAIIDDGNATTNIPNVKTLPPPTKPADASNLAFAPKDSARKIFIVGSAGGGEILASLYHNADKITAVEINGIMNELISNKLSFWTGPLIKNNNKVSLITDDARNVLNKKRLTYDVILSAHTISASAVSSGAMSLVENYIMTEEAIRDYIFHLEKNGVLYISRPEAQVPKILSTIKKVRSDMTQGTDKSLNNFVVFRRPPSIYENGKSFLAGVIYKRDGFSDQEIIKIKNEAALLNLNIEYDPTSKQEGIYKNIVETMDIDGFIKSSGLNIKPATDDKPFFDQSVGFGNLTWENMTSVFSQNEKALLALTEKPVAETTLIFILIQTVIIAGLLILLPLKLIKKDSTSRFNGRYLIYFALLGLGYIILQISMIQKFTLFLGQPVYTLLTVVSTMLFASGIGSIFSSKFLKNSKRKLIIIFSAIAVLALLIGWLNPVIFNSLTRLELEWRIVVSALMIFPLGFFLGMPFPIGISLIPDTEKRYIPFAWGINAFFSVIGSVISIILAMTIGFKAVFLLASLIYLSALYIISTYNKLPVK
jgi:hypothetical protein